MPAMPPTPCVLTDAFDKLPSMACQIAVHTQAVVWKPQISGILRALWHGKVVGEGRMYGEQGRRSAQTVAVSTAREAGSMLRTLPARRAGWREANLYSGLISIAVAIAAAAVPERQPGASPAKVFFHECKPRIQLLLQPLQLLPHSLQLLPKLLRSQQEGWGGQEGRRTGVPCASMCTGLPGAR